MHFTDLSEKHWTPTPDLATRRREYHLIHLHLAQTECSLGFESATALILVRFSVFKLHGGSWIRYQMNPANYREALIETRLDEAEGADILMVNFPLNTLKYF